MPHDPIRIADVRSWIHKAARDLLAGDHERAADPPILEDVVFHAQQAAEKVLKGFLAWHDRPFRKTHDLVEIGQACVEIDASLGAGDQGGRPPHGVRLEVPVPGRAGGADCR